MKHQLKKFLCDESGVVTMDWVVLTAGVVLMGMAFAVPVGNQMTHLSSEIGGEISTMSIATY